VAESKAARPLRLAILVFDPPALALAEGYIAELLHLLGKAGHNVFFAEKCLQELRMEVTQVARLVRRTEADAWVVGSGSREVLEWFAAQPLPAFALFGRRGGLPIAGVGPDHVAAETTATRRLIELGHRRIVQLVRRQRRLPVPGTVERAILEEMATHGIETGAFNLPDWEETSEGFHRCLKELFRHTPPTALIIDEAPFFVAALQFLAGRGLRVPENVSLVCTDADPAFAWCEPTIAHIRWDGRPVVRRVVRWAANVSHGKDDRRQTLTKAEFVEGGTIGPAK
jgi:DNA-binding LacI/PurR family transcriptional regulator